MHFHIKILHPEYFNAILIPLQIPEFLSVENVMVIGNNEIKLAGIKRINGNVLPLSSLSALFIIK